MTKAELRNHILRQLGVLGAGQTANADDAALIEQIIDNCQAELEQMEVALWPVDSIPDYAVEAFTMYVTSTVTAFGNQADLGQKMMALRMLRALTVDRRSSVGKANYF